MCDNNVLLSSRRVKCVRNGPQCGESEFCNDTSLYFEPNLDKSRQLVCCLNCKLLLFVSAPHTTLSSRVCSWTDKWKEEQHQLEVNFAAL